MRHRSPNAVTWPGKLDTLVSATVRHIDDNDARKAMLTVFRKMTASGADHVCPYKYHGRVAHYGAHKSMESLLLDGPAPGVSSYFASEVPPTWKPETDSSPGFGKYSLMSKRELFTALKEREFRAGSAMALMAFVEKTHPWGPGEISNEAMGAFNTVCHEFNWERELWHVGTTFNGWV